MRLFLLTFVLLSLSLADGILISARNNTEQFGEPVFKRINRQSTLPSLGNVEPSAGCKVCKSSLSFAGDGAKKFAVGNNIPTIPFKVKNSWAGLMPISKTNNDALYFWLWGKDSSTRSKDTIIWLHGGPDCSALLGMMTENGPYIYPTLDSKPIPNNYSWTRNANVLYVEQPAGVGFSQGTKVNQNKAGFADQFGTFLDNFFDTFPELTQGNVYFAGESYAAVYISHILHHQYANGNKHNIRGALIIDGLFSDPVVETDLVTYDFARKWAKTIGLTMGDLNAIKRQSDQCKYATYAKDHLRYPANGSLPSINKSGCQTYHTFDKIAQLRKKDYSLYRVTAPPSFPERSLPKSTPLDNAALQKYINAPIMKWQACGNSADPARFAPAPVSFPNYSKPILQSVIESSSAGVIIMHGLQDGCIISTGTEIVLQNLTWHCKQGFSAPPHQTLLDVEGKASGTFVTERGLTLALIPESGHMVALNAPATAMAALQTLLGKRSMSSCAAL